MQQLAHGRAGELHDGDIVVAGDGSAADASMTALPEGTDLDARRRAALALLRAPR